MTSYIDRLARSTILMAVWYDKKILINGQIYNSQETVHQDHLNIKKSNKIKCMMSVSCEVKYSHVLNCINLLGVVSLH